MADNQHTEESSQPFHDALRTFGFDDGSLRTLTSLDRRATPGFQTKNGKSKSKSAGEQRFQNNAERLEELQELFFANAQAAGSKRSVLLLFQGMDTSGKGSTIKRLVGSMDPQGVQQVGFKKPTEEELKHDFLWRIRKHTPKPGEIAIFDRSHYEDVLVHRVEELAPPSELKRRYGSIRQFEKDLAQDETTILKIMLHISPEKQYERLSDRLNRYDKHWKFSPSDIDSRKQWDEYMEAFRVAIEETDTDHAPWYVIPADRKWYSRLAVQQLLIETLESMNLEWPAASFDIEKQRRRLDASR